MARAAAVVDLARSHTGDANLRALRAPDRAITVPDRDRRAGEGITSRHDGGGGGSLPRRQKVAADERNQELWEKPQTNLPAMARSILLRRPSIIETSSLLMA